MSAVTMDPKTFVATLDAILDKGAALATATSNQVDDKVVAECKAIVDSPYFLAGLGFVESILDSGSATTGAPTSRLFGGGGLFGGGTPATPATPGSPGTPATPATPAGPRFGQPGHPFLVAIGKKFISNLPTILSLLSTQFGFPIPPGILDVIKGLFSTGSPTAAQDTEALARIGASLYYNVAPNAVTPEQLAGIA